MAAEDTKQYINPLRSTEAVEEHISNNAILVGDGGDFVATVSYTVSPRGSLHWLDPGAVGTLGVGAGLAIGAKAVHPEADIWLLYGDGTGGLSVMEHDTMVRHKCPLYRSSATMPAGPKSSANSWLSLATMSLVGLNILPTKLLPRLVVRRVQKATTRMTSATPSPRHWKLRALVSLSE
jgi:hypothetical protein